MFRKPSAKALRFVMLLVPVTTALTWKAKSLEKKLFGRSDEARLMNEQAPELKLRFRRDVLRQRPWQRFWQPGLDSPRTETHRP